MDSKDKLKRELEIDEILNDVQGGSSKSRRPVKQQDIDDLIAELTMETSIGKSKTSGTQKAVDEEKKSDKKITAAAVTHTAAKTEKPFVKKTEKPVAQTIFHPENKPAKKPKKTIIQAENTESKPKPEKAFPEKFNPVVIDEPIFESVPSKPDKKATPAKAVKNKTAGNETMVFSPVGKKSSVSPAESNSAEYEAAQSTVNDGIKLASYASGPRWNLPEENLLNEIYSSSTKPADTPDSGKILKRKRRRAKSDIDDELSDIPTWEERHSEEYLRRNPDDPLNMINNMSGIKATEKFYSQLKSGTGGHDSDPDVIYLDPLKFGERKEPFIDDEPTVVADRTAHTRNAEELDSWQKDFRRNSDSVADRLTLDRSEDEKRKNPSAADDGEYHSIADADAVSFDLNGRLHDCKGRIALTVIIDALLAFLPFSVHIGSLSGIFNDNPIIYFAAAILLTLIAAAVNHRVIFNGIKSMFRLRFNTGSAITLSLIFCIALNVINWHFMSQFSGNIYNATFNAAAVFGLLIYDIGSLSMTQRIAENFPLVGNDQPKRPLRMFADCVEADELARGLSIGKAAVCCEGHGKNLSDYIYHSYAVDPADDAAKRFSPFVILGALICAGISLYFSRPVTVAGIITAANAFCACYCIAIPFCGAFSGNSQLRSACMRLRKKGIMLSGYDAIEEFSDIDVMAVSASDLFPEDYAVLKGLRSAQNQTFDRSLTDVAGMLKVSGGTLKPLFFHIIQDRAELLPKVDSVVFEENLGLSGWVADHRVLLGRRRLLQLHEIELPDVDYERLYNSNGMKAVYLSTQGQFSAVFLVQYLAEPEMYKRLHAAVKQGISIAVYSTDPNITTDLIREVYELPVGSVHVMGAAARKIYKQINRYSSRPIDGCLAHNADGTSFFDAVLECRRIRRCIKAAGVLNILFSVIAILLSCGLMLTVGLGGLNILLMLIFQIITVLLIAGIPAMFN